MWGLKMAVSLSEIDLKASPQEQFYLNELLWNNEAGAIHFFKEQNNIKYKSNRYSKEFNTRNGKA